MEHLSALFDLATAYHSCRDLDGMSRALATQLSRHVKSSAVLVWLGNDGEAALQCRARWFEPGVRFATQSLAVKGLLTEIRNSALPRRFGEGEVAPKALLHLAEHDRERVKSSLYAPIPGPRGAAGVVEILNHPAGKFSGEETAFVEEAARITGKMMESLRSIEADRNDDFAAIERLTLLYDISRTFSSILELDALMPLLTRRLSECLNARACNLWLVDAKENELYLAKQHGEDPSVEEGDRVSLTEGPVGEAVQGGKPKLLAAAEDESLAQRQTEDGKFQIRTWMCAPLIKDDDILGALEMVNHIEDQPFGKPDLDFLKSIGVQATIALHNANLLEAERKVHDLGALLAISKEITSTLDLDHVLTTVVHQAATLIPFDRCAVGMWDRNSFILGAVSGESEVPRTQEMDQLRGLLEWVAGQPDAVAANQYEEGWQTTPEDGAVRMTPFLEKQEYCGFHAIPLRDDQGVVGVLALMSGDAEFLTEAHLEMLTILASQTTVAIRNARLYNEVPLMSFWQPLVEKKQKLQAMPHARWLELAAKAGLIALVLIAVPWKLRVGANATVVPAERRLVSAEVPGVVRAVHVREGVRVASGDTLAELDDGESRVKLAAAQAALETARRQMAEAENARDLAAAGLARLRAESAEAEVRLYQQWVERAHLRAQIAGVVVTPKVEEKLGARLGVGDTFCELVDQAQIAVEMNVPESQIALIRPDTKISLKLNSFPFETLTGRVIRVSAQTIGAEGEQFFVVRALAPNPDEKARPGMVGRAKITAAGGWGQSGWYPIGYVLLRDPARWLLQKIWVWSP